MKNNFHNKNFALILAFISRFEATRKWSIINLQPKLLPNKNFKEPTTSKAEKLEAEHVKC